MDNGYKKLVRSNSNKIICGVCGGVGEYLGVDPTVVRIICLILALGSLGTGAIIYIIAAIVIPEEFQD